jgi:hypothetical protein
MSDDLTFPVPSRNNMTRTASGRLAWRTTEDGEGGGGGGENGMPILRNRAGSLNQDVSGGGGGDDEYNFDGEAELESKKLKDVELIELSRSAPKTNKIFPEGFQPVVPTAPSFKIPFISGLFEKKVYTLAYMCFLHIHTSYVLSVDDAYIMLDLSSSSSSSSSSFLPFFSSI